MSWSFSGAGKPADVRAHIEALPGYGEELDPASGRAAAVALAIFELGHWPADGWSNGVLVEASGHHDGNGRNVNLTIRGIRLAEPAAELAKAHEVI
jgi:hypothetical protein